MNTNDLPPAARLAALIEAGRVANPGTPFDGRAYWHGGCGCALMFAARGGGVDVRSAADVLDFISGISAWANWHLLEAVEHAAYNGRTPEQICHSLREGELAMVAA